MPKYQFHDEYSLAEVTDQLAKQALLMGLIPSFVICYFPDSREYYIPNEVDSPARSPEEAYLLLRKMLNANQ